MKYLFYFIAFIVPFGLCSQIEKDSTTVDSAYLEDQFYLGFTYNFLLDQPQDVNQRDFSYGLHGGFIRDIPVNYDRTIALGVGLGVALNTYYSNIVASEVGNSIVYTLATESFKRSKLQTNSVEFPIQFRWRNSTATEYKFWRVYAGVKFGYVFDARSKFVPDEDSDELALSFSNTDVKKFQYGLTLDFGYSSFNAHIYYALTNLFEDDVLLNGNPIDMQPLRIGLIFYIL